MMAVVLLTCFVSLMSQQALAAAKHHEKKHDAKKQVEALEEQWRKAQLSGDVVTMDKMLADDFIGISMSGQVNTKAQQLDRVKSRRLVVTKVNLSDMKIKLVGAVAIVTCQAEVEGMNESEQMKGLYRYTRIYQMRPNGEWKITSFEATRIRPPKNSVDRKAGQSSMGPAASRMFAEPRFG
jgi:ketosteroid isomerase-like protein